MAGGTVLTPTAKMFTLCHEHTVAAMCHMQHNAWCELCKSTQRTPLVASAECMSPRDSGAAAHESSSALPQTSAPAAAPRKNCYTTKLLVAL
jgi:hypothetical protein